MRKQNLLKLQSLLLIVFVVSITFALPLNSSYAASAQCASNSVGIISMPLNVSQTSDTYSVWLNISGSKQVDIDLDIDNANCLRTQLNLNSSNLGWFKIGSNYSVSSGSHTLRIHSFSNGFNFAKGLLISDSCVPLDDGSNCTSIIPTPTTSSTTSTSQATSSTTTSMITTTTKAPVTTTTKAPLPVSPITQPTNLNYEKQSCWWLWCSAKITWKASSGGSGNIGYIIQTDSREPQYSYSNSVVVPWLPIGSSYNVKVSAYDSAKNTSPYTAITLKI